jgi:hypothetical protein
MRYRPLRKVTGRRSGKPVPISMVAIDVYDRRRDPETES